MGKKTTRVLCLGLPTIILIGISGPLRAQSPIALQPLQPLPDAERGALKPLNPPPASTSIPTGRITLEKLPTAEKAVAAQPVSAPLNVLPLHQEPKPQGEGKSTRSKFKVDDMVRTPLDLGRMFSSIKISSTDPIQATSIVRTQNSPGMGEFEWTPSGYCWQSPAFCYSPLYFEQPNLERYGNKRYPLLTPAASATYFFGQVATLPIKSLYQLPWSKSCTLGHHRPGDCAPIQRPRPQHVTPTYFESSPVSVPLNENVIFSGSEAFVQPESTEVRVNTASSVSQALPGAEPVHVKISE